MYLNEEIQNKWAPVLEHADLSPIKDSHRRSVTATLLENTEKALRENGGFAPRSLLETTAAGAPTNSMNFTDSTTNIDTYDPVLISLVRRAMPNLVAYDICGVQPMTGPTGLIFAMRSHYANQQGTEAFYDEALTNHSGARDADGDTVGDEHIGSVPGVNTNATGNTYNFKQGLSTFQAEALGNSTVAFNEMAFSIDKVSVTAKSRALKADYSMELAQDLKAIHGLDAETELANILSAEILAEINREIIRTINVTASIGGTKIGGTGVGVDADGVTTAGRFNLDVDSNGRWSVEKFKGLMFQIEREANAIAKRTRRGKGNMLICSSDVASALQMAGVLDYTPALNSNNLQVDDTGATFAGTLNGRIKVYIDPYTTGNYLTMGYKGASAFDAGLFYCPYVPLQMVRAVGEDTFQPKIGFKTRYGVVANPFSRGATASDGTLIQDSNVYYRRLLVDNLM
jgi:hypothetical protein